MKPCSDGRSAGEGEKRRERLRSKKQFAGVYSQGRVWSNELVVMRGLPNGLEFNRYGFAVGKRLGKAVKRNLIKRRLRECVRHQVLKPGWDLIFIARQGAAEVKYDRLMAAVADLLRRSRLWGEKT